VRRRCWPKVKACSCSRGFLAQTGYVLVFFRPSSPFAHFRSLSPTLFLCPLIHSRLEKWGRRRGPRVTVGVQSGCVLSFVLFFVGGRRGRWASTGDCAGEAGRGSVIPSADDPQRTTVGLLIALGGQRALALLIEAGDAGLCYDARDAFHVDEGVPGLRQTERTDACCHV
jgi:hypothetical protein